MVDGLGPSDEQVPQPDPLSSQFEASVASLADGNLLFGQPFDLATSAALQSNPGDSVNCLADFLRNWTSAPVRFWIHAEVPGLPRREVIDCLVPDADTLAALLAGLLAELVGGHDD